MRDLKGKSVILTGASRGLGEHLARELARRGANLVLAARSGGELEMLATELRGAGVRAVPVPTDVTSTDDLRALADTAERELGGADVLVNNAGVEKIFPFADLPPDDIERIVRVNLVATMLLTRFVVPGMLRRGRGHIVNMASLGGKTFMPYNLPYTGSKAGVIAFTKALRAELHGTGVSASVICPGYVEAGMFARHQRDARMKQSSLAGTVSAADVVAGVMNAIARDIPEVIVSPGPVRLLLALGELSPSLGAWLIRRLGLSAPFAEAARVYATENVEAGAAQTR